VTPVAPAADQLESLRRMVAERGPSARVVAVTSGKGGVGKTNVAVNLAVAAAQAGKRVILIDLDLGLANADVVLGVRPQATLAHVLAGRRDVADALTPAHGIQLLAGASGLETLANLEAEGRARLQEAMERLHRRADLILVDTGAGISRNVIDFVATADETVVVTTPEPTALVDAYATIKMLAGGPAQGPVRVLVNLSWDREEADRVSAGVVTVARKFLSARVDRIGYVLRDDAIGRAVRQKVPVMVGEPRSLAAGCLRNVARRLFSGGGEAVERGGFLSRLKSYLLRSA
jgi:flagellar biosynthesis protein FlhG